MADPNKPKSWWTRLNEVLFPMPSSGLEEQMKGIERPEESRRHVRSYLEVPIIFQDKENWVNATTFDVSAQGLYVRTTHAPGVNTRLRAEFTLPNGHTVRCNLRVAWINDYKMAPVVINRPPGFGAEFEGIQPQDQTAISKAIESDVI
ncbi:MAG: PilZ domain-containing protein [Acidobacteriia bacterium]|nr:PilZ domain-containing protein [Terriglobia bacterium]